MTLISLIGRRPEHNSSKGFTLIEVTIVLALIMILIGIASPSLKRVTETSKLKSTARMIRSLLAYTKDVAITEGTDYLVVFDLDNQMFWLADRSALDQGDLSLSLAGALTLATTTAQSTSSTSTTAGSTGSSTSESISRTSMILGVPQRPHENVVMLAMETNHETGRQVITTGMDYIPFSMLGTSENSAIYLASVTGRYMAVKVKRSGIIEVEQISEEELQQMGVDTSMISGVGAGR
ncbi:prepilin-type N-terminal cleavage/methylation domain-containing protein [Candidatus Poribacteria bacterium]|nr:prepilin-type N-terminal cleavage/methylation domain-containing protein [Candidatus Poribacteria bacterium]